MRMISADDLVKGCSAPMSELVDARAERLDFSGVSVESASINRHLGDK